MAFQVREFDFEAGEDSFIWKFKLSNINTSQLDFYSQDVGTRSLLHLSQDLSAQIQQAIEKKKKKAQGKQRVIRKLCQKIIKTLELNVASFAIDIEEDKLDVIAYFCKSQMPQTVLNRIMEKCKKWIISTWLSLTPQQFYKITDKYLESYIRDGKKINPDFEVLNQLYVIALGDNFNEKEEIERSDNSNLILVDINLNVDDKYISENFLWDPEDISNINIKVFVNHFLNDVLAEIRIQLEKEALEQLEKQARIQIRTQILYKSLLKRYASILLNFSAIDIPSQVKQYLILIELKLLNQSGLVIFEDKFEWDILNESNNIEEFVEELIKDQEIERKYFSELCYKIRTQINSELQRKFDLLVKTFKSIHRDRQSPKLNTQTISVLRKNVTFAMDTNLPCTDQKYKPTSNIYFNNSDLFSLLSRNMDILPEEFQQILMCKEQKKEEKQSNKLSKQQADQFLKKYNLSIDNNSYLHNISSAYNLHNVWRRSLTK